jgi:hypothetical protein
MNIRRRYMVLFLFVLIMMSGSCRKAAARYPQSREECRDAEAVIAYALCNARAANELIRIMNTVYDSAASAESDSGERSRAVSLAEVQIPMLAIPRKQFEDLSPAPSFTSVFDHDQVFRVNKMLVNEMNAQYLCLALLRTQQVSDCKELKHQLSLFSAAYGFVIVQMLSGIRTDFSPYQSFCAETGMLPFLKMTGTSAENLKQYTAGLESRGILFTAIPQGEILRGVLIKSGMTVEETKSYERRIGNLLTSVHQ